MSFSTPTSPFLAMSCAVTVTVLDLLSSVAPECHDSGTETEPEETAKEAKAAVGVVVVLPAVEFFGREVRHCLVG